MLLVDANIQSLLADFIDGKEFVARATASAVAPQYVQIAIGALQGGDHYKVALNAIGRLNERGYALIVDSARHGANRMEFVICRQLLATQAA